MRLVPLLLVLLTVPSFASAQSLGDAARREEQRRQKNKEKGVKAPLFDDTKIAPPKPAPSPSPGPSAGASPAAAAPAAVSAERDASDAEAEERKQQEEIWRGRMTAARVKRDAARRRYDELTKLSLVPGESYVDHDGRIVIRNLEHLQELVARAKAELDTAEAAINDIEDAARRAGALPGWLR
jgi:hypothetical protein